MTKIYVSEPLLTYIGAVQPTVIRTLGGEKRRQFLIERGALARVLFAWPKTTVGMRKMVGKDHEKAYTKVPIWNGMVMRLCADGFAIIAMEEASRDVFMAWHDKVMGQARPEGVYAEVREFTGKIIDAVARIAGIIARTEGRATVKVSNVKDAIRIGEY